MTNAIDDLIASVESDRFLCQKLGIDYVEPFKDRVRVMYYIEDFFPHICHFKIQTYIDEAQGKEPRKECLGCTAYESGNYSCGDFL